MPTALTGPSGRDGARRSVLTGSVTSSSNRDVVSRLYMTIYAQEFSPCGEFLAAANSDGFVSVHRLELALKRRANDGGGPINKFQGHEDPIFSMASTDRYLITGSVGQIKGWDWNHICRSAVDGMAVDGRGLAVEVSSLVDPCWTLNVPVNKTVGGRSEINSLVLRDGFLHAAAGDGCVYVWSLEKGTLQRKLEGHNDYVHCLAMKRDSPNFLVSGGEDGSLRFWDLKTPDARVSVIEPYKHSSSARPSVGKWISCVDIEEDRVLCGGGPRLSLFHLRMTSSAYLRQSSGSFSSSSGCYSSSSTEPLNVYDKIDETLQQQQQPFTPNLVQFHRDGFLSAGNGPAVDHWDLSGRLTQSLAVAPSSVYSVKTNENSSLYPVMTVAGSSHKIDLCISKGYSSCFLTF